MTGTEVEDFFINVIPAQAGISSMEISANTDSRLCGNDGNMMFVCQNNV